MTHRYGFVMIGESTTEVEADTLTEAIQLAEANGGKVQAGRRLDHAVDTPTATRLTFPFPAGRTSA